MKLVKMGVVFLVMAWLSTGKVEVLAQSVMGNCAQCVAGGYEHSCKEDGDPESARFCVPQSEISSYLATGTYYICNDCRALITPTETACRTSNQTCGGTISAGCCSGMNCVLGRCVVSHNGGEPTGSPAVPALQACSRCSTVFRNQKASWMAFDCNLNPGQGVMVVRTYDKTCNSGETPLHCQRCSTAHSNEYVWWLESDSGGSCGSVPTSESKIIRATSLECAVPTLSPVGAGCIKCGCNCVATGTNCTQGVCDTGTDFACNKVNNQCVRVEVTTPAEPIMQLCNRCSTVFLNQKTTWLAENCNTNPSASADVARTYDDSCKQGLLHCQRCSVSNGGQYVWWIPETGKDCNLFPDTTKVIVYRASKTSCVVPSGTVPKSCDRCSTVFDNQRVSGWSAVDCTANPPAGVTVTRTYDTNCDIKDVDKVSCDRCSVSNNGEYVWWMPETGKNCNLYPDATKVDIFRASNASCTVPTGTGSQQCSRCSTTFDKQWTEWRATDCSLNPGVGVAVTRTYKESCSVANKVSCDRCSVANSGEYVWWLPETGKECSSYPDATKVDIYRANRAECKSLCERCSNNGDALDLNTNDCNGVIELADFAAWVDDYLFYTAEHTGDWMRQWKADYDCNGEIGIGDFAKWLNGYMKE